MKTNLLILLLLPLFLFGQDNSNNTIKVRKTTPQADEDILVYSIVENMPQFVGGLDSLYAFLGANIKYPVDAKNQGKEDIVYISFIIDQLGNVTKPIVLRGKYEELNNEALRVISLMPNWTPGTQKGRAVNVVYNIPIKFNLD